MSTRQHPPSEHHDIYLSLTPSRLLFSPTKSNTSLIARITLTNICPSRAAVAYKFKTNSPARYSVKPVLGWIKYGDSVDVLVRANPLGVAGDIAGVEKGDRFLVQSLPLDSGEMPVDGGLSSDGWKRLDKRNLVETFVDCKVVVQPGSSGPHTIAAPGYTNKFLVPNQAEKANLKAQQQHWASVTIRVSSFELVVVGIFCFILGTVMPARTLGHFLSSLFR
ncbi:PapD-like protein [Gaertneriomyces semiglobifer]|nr:PapD-like protein [Gaertneriomyces semiglobifer]